MTVVLRGYGPGAVIPFTFDDGTTAHRPTVVLIRVDEIAYCPMPTEPAPADASDPFWSAPWCDTIVFSSGHALTVTAERMQWRMLADAVLATSG